VHGREQDRGSGRRRVAGARRAALAGLLLGAALWNSASLWHLAGSVVIGLPSEAAAPPAAGCTSLLLDRPSGRTVAWPCTEPAAWLESALSGARVATAAER
jgi:hypothetical protein